MQKLLLLCAILLLIGCASDKKKSDPQIEPIVETTESIPEPEAQDTAVIKQVTDTDIQDSIAVIEASIEEKVNTKKTPKKDRKSQKKETKKKKEKPSKKEVAEKTRPDHTAWSQLTKKYVSYSGKVNYKGFKSDMASIEKYLLHLQKVAPQKDWSKKEKLAYWFNLYNAATVQLIAKSYPVKSIKDINNGKPWDKKFIKSGDRIYSLNQIENSIVRPYFNEPRLHVAFNCAAVSCPKLMKGAFIPSKLNYQLTILSKAWLNDVSKNKITENTIAVSKIFEWYAGDFKKGIIPFINTYSKTKTKPNATLTYLEYDWSLND